MEPITPGDDGDAVQDVQRRLRALGHAVDDDETGTFGPGTHAAVRRFQPVSYTHLTLPTIYSV